MRIVIVLLFCAAFSGCIVTDVVYGNGTSSVLKHSASRFNGELTVDFPAVITIDSGEGAVEITTDENLQCYYTVDTVDGKIAVHRDSRYKLISTAEKISITVPWLRKISLTDAAVLDTIQFDSLRTAELNGTAKCAAVCTGSSFSGVTKGKSSLTLLGSVKHLILENSSSESQKCGALAALTSEIDQSGSGDITVSVISELFAAITGSGNILLSFPTPLTDVRIYGSGKIVTALPDSSSSAAP